VVMISLRSCLFIKNKLFLLLLPSRVTVANNLFFVYKNNILSLTWIEIYQRVHPLNSLYIKPKYHRRRAPFFQKSSENLATVDFNFELVNTPSICLHVVPKLDSTDGCWALEHETYKVGLSLCRIATAEGR
jgi:hypothetical protein